MSKKVVDATIPTIPLTARFQRWFGRNLIRVYMVLAFTYLFIPAAGDYVNAAILGSPNTKMIGNVIESRYFKIVDYPTAAALSFTLMAAILILVTVYIRKAGTEELV